MKRALLRPFTARAFSSHHTLPDAPLVANFQSMLQAAIHEQRPVLMSTDLDDTLCYARPAYRETFKHTCRALAIHPDALIPGFSGADFSQQDLLVTHFLHMPRKQIGQAFAKHMEGHVDENSQHALRMWDEQYHRCHLDSDLVTLREGSDAYLHALDYLKQEHQARFYTMMVSRKTHDRLCAELEHMDVASLFDYVQGDHKHLKNKPHPDPVYYCYQQHRLSGELTGMHVGDAETDARFARAANLRFIHMQGAYPVAMQEGEHHVTSFEQMNRALFHAIEHTMGYSTAIQTRYYVEAHATKTSEPHLA